MKKLWDFICILWLLFKLPFVLLERAVTGRIINHFKSKELLEIGTQLTFYYFLLFLIFFWWRIPELYDDNTGINGVGDFLAGLFSPIAFGWLIIGYLMQNKELKNQLLEFKRNAETNRRQLIINHHSTIERHNVAQPILSIKSKKYKSDVINNQEKNLDSGFFVIEISNAGADLKSLTIYLEDEKKIYYEKEKRYLSTLTFVASADILKSNETSVGIINIDKIFVGKIKSLEKHKKINLGNIHIKFFDSIGNSKEVIIDSYIKKKDNFYEISHSNIKTDLPLPEMDYNGN